MTPEHITTEEFLSRLQGVTGHDPQWSARCPAHDDASPSLSVKCGDNGGTVFNCHAECSPEAVVSAMGLTLSQLMPDRPIKAADVPWAVEATYDYHDADGNFLYQKRRYRTPEGGKAFGYRHKDSGGKWVKNKGTSGHVLYRLPEVVKAPLVFLVEGEKDVDTLKAHGFTATASPLGAGVDKWPAHFTDWFKGKVVYIIQDNDDIGKAFAITEANAISKVAREVKLLDLTKVYPELPNHGDISDLLGLVGVEDGLALLDKLVRETVPFVAFVTVNPEYENTKSEEDAPPPKLAVLSAIELMARDLGEVVFLVYEFLHQGLGVLSADPKIGKSWFALDLCLSIATGTPFLGYETVRAGALYLALEDSWRRLKGRMKKVMGSKGIETPDNFYMAIAANPLDMGLSEQIDGHMAEHPDTRLIVVDVLERIRSGKAPRNKNAYQIDSAEIAKIKVIADKYNICILLIHHNRKMRDASDSFLNMSGSQGILSSVDEGFSLEKETREAAQATLSIISREMGDSKIIIEFDRDACRWRRVSTFEDEQERRERAAYDAAPVVKTIKGLLGISPLGIELTSRELSEHMPTYADTIMDTQAIGHTINRFHVKFYEYDKIIHSTRTSNGKRHSFKIHEYQQYIIQPLQPLQPLQPIQLL